MDASKKTNVAIAAFCTTYARLELYKALDKLGDQVCYMDTDSCVYVSYPGCQEIATGELLGDWTDELLKLRRFSFSSFEVFAASVAASRA